MSLWKAMLMGACVIAFGCVCGAAWAQDDTGKKDPPPDGPPPRAERDRPAPRPDAPRGEDGPGRRPPPPPRDWDSAGPQGGREGRLPAPLPVPPRDREGRQPGPPRDPDQPGPPDRPGPRGEGPGPRGEGPMGPGPRGEGPMGRGPGMGPPFGPPRPRDDFGNLERNDPEMFKALKEEAELERQTLELSRQFRQAPKDRREELKKEIEVTVGKHFEVRQQRRLLEVKRLESEVQRLRDSIESRNKVRAEIIKRRIGELTGEGDELQF